VDFAEAVNVDRGSQTPRLMSTNHHHSLHLHLHQHPGLNSIILNLQLPHQPMPDTQRPSHPTQGGDEEIEEGVEAGDVAPANGRSWYLIEEDGDLHQISTPNPVHPLPG
jgi:hypothetical protein